MDSEPSVLVSGLGLVESVRWQGGAVWFSDWTAGTIHRVDPRSGADRVVAEVVSLPLCFDFAGDDLVVFDSAAGALLRGAAGALTPWADLSGLALGAGNEIVATGRGDFFVNFGNFDPRQGFPTTPVGLIAHVSATGATKVVADALAFPNGMAISADGTTLVVAESHAARLTGFTIAADGSLTDRRVWADVPGSAPDGITMMPDGTCWFADVPNRAVVGVTEGGTVRGRVELDRGAFSCTAGPDGALFVAAAHWPGGERMFDPSHRWDGSLLRIDNLG